MKQECLIIKERIEVNDEDIKKNEDVLIRMFGKNGYKNVNIIELKKSLLLIKVKRNIKNCQKGDIIYKFNPWKDELESLNEYVVFSLKQDKNKLLNDGDIIINNGNGYIAGGLNGYAVLKDDWNQYLKELEVLKE